MAASLGATVSTHATTGTPNYNWTLTYESELYPPIVLVDEDGQVGLPLDKYGLWTAVLTVSGFEVDGIDPIERRYYIYILP